MPKVKVNDININYEQQGSGEPLVLIPYLATDSACYAFQVAEYAKHFTCISVDPRGAGETDKPEGTYSMELFADDVCGVMQAIGVDRAHVTGLSLGAATGMWLAAKYPERVKSLSVHSGWPKTDLFLKTVVESWRLILQATGSVTELIIAGNLSVVFHARSIRQQSGLHSVPLSICAQPANATGRSFHPANRCGVES